MRHAPPRAILTPALIVAAFATSADASTIAITEFMANPWGPDLRRFNPDTGAPEGLEWIELFNHGPAAVNLQGWTLKDNATTRFTFGDVTIPSGGYIIAASRKSLFEERWLESQADARVIDGVPFQMNNGTDADENGVTDGISDGQDGLYLRNAAGDLVWSLGFDSVGAYRGTWLTGNDFSQNYYGEPPQTYPFGAYINRNGNDGSAMDMVDLGLGYEGNEFTTDPFAYASAARSEDDPLTPEDESLIEREFGSPLLGQYQAVPEPASLALLAAGSLLIARRRAMR